MKFLKQLIAPVLAAVIATGGANAALYQWSKTAATNATADSTINYSEGQSPSSINDSARAAMARIAEWRDDFSGLLTTGGTSTVYTVTSNQGLPSTPTDGQLISIRPHVTNGNEAVLHVDGGTGRAIVTASNVRVAAGVMIANTPYDLTYNVAEAVWHLKSYYGNPVNVPLGAVLDYTGTTAPNSNFALANGQCISRTTYAAYFTLVSTTFGACDGSTTFAVPDLSNRVVAGLQMSGTARITVAGGNFDGNTLGAAGGAQNHTITLAQLPANITPAGSISAYTPTGSLSLGTPAGSVSVDTPTGSVSTTINGQSAGVIIQNNAGPAATTTAGANWTIATLTASSSFTGNALSASFTGNALSGTFTGDPASLTFTGTPFGSGNSHPIVQPTMVLSKIVRIF